MLTSLPLPCARAAAAADLKSPTGGGQTAFPDAEITKEAMGAEHRGGNSPGEWYCSDDRALAASPAPGTGVLFWCVCYRSAGGNGGCCAGSQRWPQLVHPCWLRSCMRLSCLPGRGVLHSTNTSTAHALICRPSFLRPLPACRDYRPGNGSNTGSYKDGSAEPAAETVYAAMHSGCPVLEGEKYIATRWIRAAGFDYPR